MRIGRPAPGYASAADVSVKTILPHPGHMRRNKFPLNRFGAVGDAVRRSPLGAGEQKRFCPLLGLRPKGGAARHPCSIVLNMAAPHTWERFGCQTIDSILLPDTRQGKIRFRKRNAFRNAGRRLACEDFFRLATCRRQATYFFEREKVGKKRFSRLSGRGKRNRRRFRRRGSS